MHKVATPRKEAKDQHRLFCTAVLENGKECLHPVAPEAPTTFCTVHGLLAAEWMLGHHRDLVDRILALEVEEARDRARQAQMGPNFDRYLKFAVVYYLRFGNRIKIGTTTNLPQRLEDLPHDEVLAVEPGSNAQERGRHAQFREDRVHREWFNPSSDLMALTVALRAKYGEPMAYWEEHAGYVSQTWT